MLQIREIHQALDNESNFTVNIVSWSLNLT